MLIKSWVWNWAAGNWLGSKKKLGWISERASRLIECLESKEETTLWILKLKLGKGK